MNLTLDKALQKGIEAQLSGNIREADKFYTAILQAQPNHPDANHNMGTLSISMGNIEAALPFFRTALEANFGVAQYWYSYISALVKLNRFSEAESLLIDARGKGAGGDAFDELEHELFSSELKVALQLGIQRISDQEAVIDIWKQDLKGKPGQFDVHSNIGLALHNQGNPTASIDSFKQALKVEPDYEAAWNNIVYPMRVIMGEVQPDEDLASLYPEDTTSQHAQIKKMILKHILNLGTANAESTFVDVVNLLSDAKYKNIQNPKANKNRCAVKPALPNKLVALVHFGRSGTGLLHSLVDGHPEVSTMPSIYFSEYFDYSIWEKIIVGGWGEMVDRFIANYESLFDASTQAPTPTKSGKFIDGLGLKEGLANVGPQRDEVLKVDKLLFSSELNRLMECCDQLNPLIFFKLVQAAYNKAINDLNHKNLLFYHIHNPAKYAQLNFATLAPNAEWLIMVREPIQSCESWLTIPLSENDYSGCHNRILEMLFEIDNVVYHKQNSVGLRLEDLKEYPRKTIPALCKWMGVDEIDSLYEMTAQGKRWWGDPSSPEFAKEGMDPFGKTAINRKVGSVFGASDQFILRTLFYPFSVRFGYAKENTKQFELDLQKIRPMINEMFDFEKTITKRTQVHPEHFIKLGSFSYFRSGLIDRWKVLNQHHTYPNMITPLKLH